MKTIKTIAVIGDGGWGTTLAIYLAHKKFKVTLWGAFAENIDSIRQTGENTKFLPGFKVPAEVALTSDLNAAVLPADLIVLAVPSQFLTGVLKKLKQFDFKQKTVLSVVKGIETGNLKRMSQIILEELGKIQLGVLSGPTIAREVAAGIPSTAVIASTNSKTSTALQKVFNSDTFRIYTNTDLIGLELGGSLKNVIAIACGICDGLGFGTNTKAAIMTRGLVEMANLGKAMGAKKETFTGLTGLGDLVTTCVSPQSRNRCVGEQLGKGKSIQEILSSMAMVAEGVETAKAAYRLSKKYKLAMPITTEVYNIVHKGKSAQKAVKDLMSRTTKAEN